MGFTHKAVKWVYLALARIPSSCFSRTSQSFTPALFDLYQEYNSFSETTHTSCDITNVSVS